MNRKKRIEHILLNNFKDWKIQVIDDSIKHRGHNNFDGSNETHFQIIIKKNSTIKEKTIKIHRKINELLKKEFKSGLHALEIKIYN